MKVNSMLQIDGGLNFSSVGSPLESWFSSINSTYCGMLYHCLEPGMDFKFFGTI